MSKIFWFMTRIFFKGHVELRLVATVLAAVALTAAPDIDAQVTSRSAFTTAPTKVLPTLPQSTRLDMLDYFDGGSAKLMTNALDGPAKIEALEDQLIELTTGSSSRMALAVLPSGKKEIIMVVSQLATPAIDSYIKFYNSRWDELDADKLFSEPSLDDWVGKLKGDERVDAENIFPLITYKADYQPSTKTLTLTPTVKELLPEETRERGMKMLARSLTYQWNGKQFKLVK